MIDMVTNVDGTNVNGWNSEELVRFSSQSMLQIKVEQPEISMADQTVQFALNKAGLITNGVGS